MHRSRAIFAAATTVVGLLTAAGAAQAHPRLLSASPAANAVVGSTRTVQLRFSERLEPRFSGAEVAMLTGGRTTPVRGAVSAVAADRVTLIVTLPAPLRQGQYQVSWRVVAADSHRITGSYAFRVR